MPAQGKSTPPKYDEHKVYLLVKARLTQMKKKKKKKKKLGERESWLPRPPKNMTMLLALQLSAISRAIPER